MPYGNDREAIIYHRTAGTLEQWQAFDEEEVREAAIFRATWYLDGVYGNRFSGTPSGAAEEWPRVGATDRYGRALPENELPSQITEATFVAALYDLQNPGVLWKALDPARQVKSSGTGPIKKQFFENQFGDPVILQSVEAKLRRLLIRVSRPKASRLAGAASRV